MRRCDEAAETEAAAALGVDLKERELPSPPVEDSEISSCSKSTSSSSSLVEKDFGVGP